MGFQVWKTGKRTEKKKDREEKEQKEIHFWETQSFEIHFVRTTVRELLFHNNHFWKRVFTWRINLDWGVLLGFFKTVTGLSFCTNQGVFSTLLDPVWIKICVVFIVILWKSLNNCIGLAIGVSLVFLLKLIGSCGEQLINLAGFLISTGSRNWVINCMWIINWVSGTFFASGVEKTGRNPWGRVNQYKIDCVSSS